MNQKLLLFLTQILLISSLSAQMQDRPVADAALKILPKVVEWRRHMHQHPELSNREFETAKYVENHLRKLGLEVRTGIAHTGVVGILKGGLPGKVVALRADMDALPVTERLPLAFASKDSAMYNGSKVGVMHACGHDAHTAILMGTAEVLASMKDKIRGTVVFIFQPAEEGPPRGEKGGAPMMVAEGVMDNPKVDAVFGLHMSSSLEIGKISYKPGASQAASDRFYVKVKGKQAHGSQPWKAVDPILTAAEIVLGFQTVVSRMSELTKAPVVITVGKFHGGVRENIIPETCEISGTIRTLDEGMRKKVHEDMRRIAQNFGEANGAEVEMSIEEQTLVVVNDTALVRQTLPSLERAAGKNKVELTEWMTGAEDFSYFGLKAPAFFFFLGGMPAGGEKAKAPSHHTPEFFIDDSKLEVGVRAFCNLVFDYLK